MKLWRISQDINNGYDTFDSAVVAANNEKAARETEFGYGWCSSEHVKAEHIGEAKRGTKPGIIVASFNAG